MVSILNYSRYRINTTVWTSEGTQWRFSGIHGLPMEHERRHTWNLIRRLSEIQDLSWICGGGFNEILTFGEKAGERAKFNGQMQAFSDALEDCGLIDLGFSGQQYTWKNNQDGEKHVKERLDKFVCGGLLSDMHGLSTWVSGSRTIVWFFSV